MCFFIDVPGKQMLHVGDVQMCKWVHMQIVFTIGWNMQICKFANVQI